MMARTMRSIFLILVVFIAGCSSAPKKSYVAPENEFAESCIRQCNVTRTSCKRRGLDAREICLRDYQVRLIQFNNCRRVGDAFCIKPQECPLPDTEHCSVGYDECFQACGGQIVVEEQTAN